jgi:hypothetical protein
MVIRITIIVISVIAGIVATPVAVSSETRSNDNAITLPISISEVYGLQQALNIRPVMGTGFNIDAAAVIGPTGAINAALGNQSNCLLVGGTSAPCTASTQAAATIVDSEIPTGTMNSANAVFTLANVPNPPGSLHVYWNGVRMSPRADYTLAGNVLTFNGPSVPAPTDILVVDYRF